MPKKRAASNSSALPDQQEEGGYVLKLYITGASPNSTRAVVNIKMICEQYINHNYDLEIIDVYQQPELARKEQLVALPLLIKKFPLPVRRLVGDLSNNERVLHGLGLKT